MAPSSKTCTRCKVAKPLDAFSKHPKARDGRQSHCKTCVAERARGKKVGRPCTTCGIPLPADARPWARVCDTCLAVCTQCKSNPRTPSQRICSTCQAENDKSRKSPQAVKLRDRITRIASKYKVRPAFAAALSSFSTCEACGKEQTRSGEMHVDHCHKTGAVRGVLCFNCNAALGHVNDSQERLQKLKDYLAVKETFKARSDLEKVKHYIDLLIELEARHGSDAGS